LRALWLLRPDRRRVPARSVRGIAPQRAATLTGPSRSRVQPAARRAIRGAWPPRSIPTCNSSAVRSESPAFRRSRNRAIRASNTSSSRGKVATRAAICLVRSAYAARISSAIRSTRCGARRSRRTPPRVTRSMASRRTRI